MPQGPSLHTDQGIRVCTQDTQHMHTLVPHVLYIWESSNLLMSKESSNKTFITTESLSKVNSLCHEMNLEGVRDRMRSEVQTCSWEGGHRGSHRRGWTTGGRPQRSLAAPMRSG